MAKKKIKRANIDSHLISFTAYDHEKSRNCTVSIDYTGIVHVDGVTIAERNDSKKSKASEEEESEGEESTTSGTSRR